MAGGNGGGLSTTGGSATLAADLIAGNAAGNGGVAPFIDGGLSVGGPGGNGGGIYASAPLTLSDSTITGNAAGLGGADAAPLIGNGVPGAGGGLYAAAGSAKVSYATIAGNTDGIDNAGAAVSVTGTIVADSTGNPAIQDSSNCTGTITDQAGFNLDSAATCGFAQPTDISSAEPLLAPLAANGGPTETEALQVGSPAIDHGATVATGCPGLDQRGVARPDDGAGSQCDIGAFESQAIG